MCPVFNNQLWLSGQDEREDLSFICKICRWASRNAQGRFAADCCWRLTDQCSYTTTSCFLWFHVFFLRHDRHHEQNVWNSGPGLSSPLPRREFTTVFVARYKELELYAIGSWRTLLCSNGLWCKWRRLFQYNLTFWFEWIKEKVLNTEGCTILFLRMP